MREFAAALALIIAAPLGAQEATAWRAVDTATGQISDVAGLEQLARDFPDSASVRVRLLRAQLAAGQADAALVSLEWLKARNHAFSARGQQQIAEMIGAAHADQARALLDWTPKVLATSTVFGEIPADAGLVESLLVEPVVQGMVATSVSGRSVFVSGAGMQWLEIKLPGANALSGVVSAPDKSVGWVASANIAEAPVDPSRFTGLIGLTGDFNNSLMIPAPEGVVVSDLAVGPDGTVYASDPVGGGVYLARPDAERLTELVRPGILRSAQGLAVSADGQKLYVSDYRYGLAVITLASGKVMRLASDIPAALDGVDGLWLDGDELIAVQNGATPMRISAFRLSADGMRVIAHRVIEQANPEWTEPLGGSVADGALYYVGNGQWERYDKGALREGLSPLPTQIRRVPLQP